MEMFNQDLDGDCSSCHEMLHDSILLKLNLQGVCACILCIIRLAVLRENWFSGMIAEH